MEAVREIARNFRRENFLVFIETSTWEHIHLRIFSIMMVVQLSISIRVTVDKNNLAMKSVEVKC